MTQGGNLPGSDAAEVARFDALAAEWWDPRGPMRELHRMNPLRTRWILDRVPARPLRWLDVGCGAGLAAEVFARAGHAVTGIDAAPAVIAAARTHAGVLAVDYRVATTGVLRSGGERFDVVTALEVIEHVADQPGFVAELAGLLAPGGQVFLSTLNRTPESFVAAKVGAEWVLRLLPAGTHDWRRFVPPTELGRWMRAAGVVVSDGTGMGRGVTGWRATAGMAVNYLMAGRRGG